jgi:parallel beta-helix repeat protein
MTVGSNTTADGITSRPDYAYDPPPSFFQEGAVPTGADVYNVMDYGAKASATFDSRPAIQAAIDAANAAGGGLVYIPPGTFGVGQDPEGSGSVVVTDNVFVKGAGMGQTTLRVLDHVGDVVTGIMRTPFGKETNNTGISDITLDGNRANNDPLMKIDGYFSGGIPGDTITAHDITLLRMEVKDCSGYGFDPHERTERLLIDSCTSHGNGKDGFVADYIIDGEYRNNIAYDNDRHGFNITTTTNDFVLHDNVAYGNGSTGAVVQRGNFDIDVPYNIVISDNHFYDNAREGILVQLGENVLIENNLVEGSGRSGVRIFGGNNVTVRGNTIRNSSQSGHEAYSDIQITDYNDKPSITGRTFGSHDNLITGNTIFADGEFRTKYGIVETDGDVGHNVIGPNITRGQTHGAFSITALTSSATFVPTNGNDGVSGSSRDDVFNGLGGEDTLKGGGGNDILNGGAGADKLSGGKGDDTFYVDNAGDKVSEKLNEGDDTVISSVSLSLKANVENLRLVGPAAFKGKGNDIANQIIGNDAANQLAGMAGNDDLRGGNGADRLDGGAGNDTLVGGAGADTMVGGLGDDTFHVDDAGDKVSEAIGGGIDTVYTSVSIEFGKEVEKIILTGSTEINVKGGAAANTITGNAAKNILEGGTGNDRLAGGGGNDILKGGEGSDLLNGGMGSDLMSGGIGNDTYHIDSALDIVVEKAGGGKDLLISTVSLLMKDFFEELKLVGAGAIDGRGNRLDNTITGNNAANTLRGEAGSDRLIGGYGNDTLQGGEGNDIMTGGGGADTFRFTTGHESGRGAGADFINDFSSRLGDKLDFSSVDRLPGGGHEDVVFIGTYGFFGVGGELRFQIESDGARVQYDANGDRLADTEIFLQGVKTLGVEDFLI